MIATAALVAIAVSRDASEGSSLEVGSGIPATSVGQSDGVPASTGDSAAVAVGVVGVAATTTQVTTTTTTATVPLAPPDGKTSSERRLVDSFIVEDADLQPKSIVSSENGLFFAQNMMYRHNVAVYDRSGNKVAVIPDEVDLSAFGIPGGGVVQGSPVEAAITPDGKYVYVSNYKMFGAGYSAVADDECDRGNWEDSYVYKIDVATFEIVAVVPTGAVPKFLAVSPDGSTLVVSNWCGFDVSFIDTATNTEVGRTPVGVDPTALAAIGNDVYVSSAGDDTVDHIDAATGEVDETFDTGAAPGGLPVTETDLWVANTEDDTVSRISLG